MTFSAFAGKDIYPRETKIRFDVRFARSRARETTSSSSTKNSALSPDVARNKPNGDLPKPSLTLALNPRTTAESSATVILVHFPVSRRSSLTHSLSPLATSPLFYIHIQIYKHIYTYTTCIHTHTHTNTHTLIAVCVDELGNLYLSVFFAP